jgi:hypothetical protein
MVRHKSVGSVLDGRRDGPRKFVGLEERDRQACTPKSSAPATAIHAALAGADKAAAFGIRVEASAPVLALCRALIDAGHDPATPLVASRGDVACLIVGSIGEASTLTLAGKGIGFRRRGAVVGGPPVAPNPPAPAKAPGRAGRTVEPARRNAAIRRGSADSWNTVRGAIERQHAKLAITDPSSPRIKPTLASLGPHPKNGEGRP